MMRCVKHIILAVLCAVVAAPVAAKGVCTQSDLDSVAEMSQLQERLFNPVRLTGIKMLLHLQPFHNETAAERALVKTAMRDAANQINAAFGVKLVHLVGEIDIVTENTTIVVPINYAHSSILGYAYPDIDWSTKMGYATQDAIIIVADAIISEAETYEVNAWEMRQSVIMHELAHKIGLQHWFEYGDKEDVCLMGEVGKNPASRACIPLDFCAAEKTAIKAIQ